MVTTAYLQNFNFDGSRDDKFITFDGPNLTDSS